MGIILGTNLKYITFSWKNASYATKSITCVMVLIAWALNNEPLDLTLLAKCQQEVQTIWDWLIIFNPRTLSLEGKKKKKIYSPVCNLEDLPIHPLWQKKYKTVSLIKPGIWLEIGPLDWSKRKKKKKGKTRHSKGQSRRGHRLISRWHTAKSGPLSLCTCYICDAVRHLWSYSCPIRPTKNAMKTRRSSLDGCA